MKDIISNLTPDSELIYNLISINGVMTTTQAEDILKGYFENINANIQTGIVDGKYKKKKAYTPDTCVNILKRLCLSRRIKTIDEKYHIPFYKKDLDTRKIPSLWVLLDLATNEYGCDPKFLEQVTEGNGIIDISYIQDEKIVVNLVYVLPNDKSKVIATRQRFYDYTGCAKGEEMDQSIAYVYVTESLEAADMVASERLPFRHQIALVEGNLTGHPTIKYMQGDV